MWLVRLYWLSGYPSFSAFQHSLGFQSRFLKSQQIFGNNLLKTASLPVAKNNTQSLLLRHSTMATWLISLPSLVKSNEEEFGRLMSTHSHMNEQLMFNFDASWQSCPVCRDEDLCLFGSSYWHVSHQLPSITHCRFHGKRLEVALEPVKNLYHEQLPHYVEAWCKPEREECESIDAWERFVLKVHDQCINDPLYGFMLRENVEQSIGIVGKNTAQRRRECEVLTPEFETALGDSLLRHLFRSHAKLGKLAKVNILNTLFASQNQSKGVRNPVFWLAIAYWLRHKIGVL